MLGPDMNAWLDAWAGPIQIVKDDGMLKMTELAPKDVRCWFRAGPGFGEDFDISNVCMCRH